MPEDVPDSVWDFSRVHPGDEDHVIAGADLAPGTVLAAYRHGLFPMPSGGLLVWWSPLERGVLGPGDLHVSRSLRKSCRRFTITVDQDFEQVVEACADPRRPGGWISAEIRAAYGELHRLGWAHSVEVRDDQGALVGGLYGVALGRLFCGESMFHRVPDASKVALVALVELFGEGEPWLIDTQWQTPHLARLGVRTIHREEYRTAIEPLFGLPGPFEA